MEDLLAARDLCAELEYLTLALAVAREVIRAEGWSCESLLAEIREKDPVAWSEGVDGEFEESLGKHPSLVRLFDTSAKLLSSEDPVLELSAVMLMLAGWFAPSPIPVALLQDAVARWTGWLPEDLPDVRTTAGRIVKIGMAAWVGNGALHLHRLVSQYVRAVTTRAECQSMLGAMTQASIDIHPTTDALIDCSNLLPHLENAVVLAKSEDPESVAEIFLTYSLVMKVRDNFPRAARAAEDGLAFARESSVRTQLHLAAAQAYQLADDFEPASRHLDLAGGSQPSTLDPAMRAQILITKGRVARRTKPSHALGFLQEALSIQLESNDKGVALTYGDIANIHSDQGDYVGARRLLETAIEHLIPRVATTNVELAVLRALLGRALIRTGQRAEARDQYLASLTVLEDRLGVGVGVASKVRAEFEREMGP